MTRAARRRCARYDRLRLRLRLWPAVPGRRWRRLLFCDLPANGLLGCRGGVAPILRWGITLRGISHWLGPGLAVTGQLLIATLAIRTIAIAAAASTAAATAPAAAAFTIAALALTLSLAALARLFACFAAVISISG